MIAFQDTCQSSGSSTANEKQPYEVGATAEDVGRRGMQCTLTQCPAAAGCVNGVTASAAASCSARRAVARGDCGAQDLICHDVINFNHRVLQYPRYQYMLEYVSTMVPGYISNIRY